MQHDRLIQMANQIAGAFAYLSRRPDGELQAVAAVEGHIRAFWDPRMRAKIFTLVVAAGADPAQTGLDPIAFQAVDRLRAATNAA